MCFIDGTPDSWSGAEYSSAVSKFARSVAETSAGWRPNHRSHLPAFHIWRRTRMASHHLVSSRGYKPLFPGEGSSRDGDGIPNTTPCCAASHGKQPAYD